MNIRQRGVPGGVAGDDRGPQFVHAGWRLHSVTRAFHGAEHTVKQLEHRKKCGCAGIPGVWRKVEQDDRDLALSPLGPAQHGELLDPSGEHIRAFDARVHVASALRFRKQANLFAACAG